ncbi:MAG: hypothetical protein IPI67_23180 [Myxococcales bacterium]|nr:hypothetical protein [Myxococcales bacterium]
MPYAHTWTPARLKQELQKGGVRLTSDTGGEIVAHLINRALDAGAASLFLAMRQALGQVRGAYGSVCSSPEETCARFHLA